jgi:hypothetical protein
LDKDLRQIHGSFAIAIPSYKRARTLMSKPNTLDYIHHELLKETILCVRESESMAYSALASKYPGLFIGTIPDETDGIPETRDLMIEGAIKQGIRYLVMIDDDLKFAWRPTMDNQYENMSHSIFMRMIKECLSFCGKQYPIVGITARQFSQEKKKEYDENTRIIQFYCLHLPTIQEAKVRFQDAGIPFMTDYYFVIKMLQLGYRNLCLNRYTRDDKMQAPGGCAETRHVNVMNSSAYKLSKIFPSIVKPYVKENGTWKEKRINVRVGWKKAFNKKLWEIRNGTT